MYIFYVGTSYKLLCKFINHLFNNLIFNFRTFVTNNKMATNLVFFMPPPPLCKYLRTTMDKLNNN